MPLPLKFALALDFAVVGVKTAKQPRLQHLQNASVSLWLSLLEVVESWVVMHSWYWAPQLVMLISQRPISGSVL